MVRYADELCCDYLMLTNGCDTLFYHYEEEVQQYLQIEEFPVYEDMLKGKPGNYVIDESDIERTPFDQLEKKFLKCVLLENILTLGIIHLYIRQLCA